MPLDLGYTVVGRPYVRHYVFEVVPGCVCPNRTHGNPL